jgi:hypothetical protein
MLRGEVTNTNYTVFGLTQAGFELTRTTTQRMRFEIYEKSYIIYITNIWIVTDCLLYTDSACQKAYLPNPVVFFMLIGNGNGLYFPEIYINRFVFQNMWICICILRVYFRILKYMIKWSWKWDLRTLITNDI